MIAFHDVGFVLAAGEVSKDTTDLFLMQEKIGR
jgi:hypothetical protein